MGFEVLKPIAFLVAALLLAAFYSLWGERQKEEEAQRARGWRVNRIHGHKPEYEEFDGRRWHTLRFKFRSTGHHTSDLIPTPSWSEIGRTFKASREEILRRLNIPGFTP